MRRALLALTDGTTYAGWSFGAEGETSGEVVFNTSMTGYQEVLSDPSYKGQMVVMTYPEIGNYGVNPEDFESSRIHVEGFIVKEAWETPSNWRATKSLHEFLREQGIVGIQGIDTRALTKHLREHGAMIGVISTEDLEGSSLVEKARVAPTIEGRDLVAEVTCKAPFHWDTADWAVGEGYRKPRRPGDFRVVAYDFGVKYNILRQLTSVGCDVTVVPARTTAEEVLALDPHGVFLSNGPGDPQCVPYAAEAVRKLMGKKPIFGICLGNQIIGLALGGTTRKLKFGHHGANQPVKDLSTEKVEITSQNHNFVVDLESLRHSEHAEAVEVTHINLNDQTVEGIRHKKYPLFSVQYHPEASPGPHDAAYLFRRFAQMMERAG
ncbi:MAG: glutamine-hydrolyzing carbamoyl-phosphate synthase small subunit [Deltaproteobacteria bacterium]|nr:glutamine-hydrolyzing carbamoyl-phosphate synthase small subunit [Deltaproteobacteria bacterium]